ENLNFRGINCGILSAQRSCYPLTTNNALSNIKTYEGIINTLYQLSQMVYLCANGVDNGAYGKAAAADLIKNIEDCVYTLIEQNGDNCFTTALYDIINLCEECTNNNAYSKYLRAVQIAIADTLLNITLT
ncbi:MAG: hypothetical protein LUI60_03715, partial [Clostridia bacterium]|nr:hypothetical protein [Clostridia bacterium]